MLKSKELRKKAWDSLKGKYWMALLVVIVTGVLYSIGSSFVSYSQSMMDIVNMVDPSQMDATMKVGAMVITGASLVVCIIGLLISIFVGNAAMVGCCNYFIKNTDSKPSFKDAFSGYKIKYGRNTGTLLLMGIK